MSYSGQKTIDIFVVVSRASQISYQPPSSFPVSSLAWKKTKETLNQKEILGLIRLKITYLFTFILFSFLNLVNGNFLYFHVKFTVLINIILTPKRPNLALNEDILNMSVNPRFSKMLQKMFFGELKSVINVTQKVGRVL